MSPLCSNAAPQIQGAAFAFRVLKPVEKLGYSGDFLGTKDGFSTLPSDHHFYCGKVPIFSTTSPPRLPLRPTEITSISQFAIGFSQTVYGAFPALSPRQSRPYTVMTVLINQSFNKKGPA
jgi:hypothetical protein